MESEARNPYTALKRRYATLQRNALHVQNALVRPHARPTRSIAAARALLPAQNIATGV